MFEVDGGKERLEDARQYHRVFLPAAPALSLAEHYVVAKAQLDGKGGKCVPVYEPGPQAGKLPLGCLRKGVVEQVAYNAGQHGVAKKFEPLVGLLLFEGEAALLVQKRAVHEYLLQQALVLEGKGQRGVEFVERSLFLHVAIFQLSPASPRP